MLGKTIKGNFEWDEDKNKANILKHGISFESILEMFDDPLFLEEYDVIHSDEKEIRTLGMTFVNGLSIVVSCYTEGYEYELYPQGEQPQLKGECIMKNLENFRLFTDS